MAPMAPTECDYPSGGEWRGSCSTPGRSQAPAYRGTLLIRKRTPLGPLYVFPHPVRYGFQVLGFEVRGFGFPGPGFGVRGFGFLGSGFGVRRLGCRFPDFGGSGSGFGPELGRVAGEPEVLLTSNPRPLKREKQTRTQTPV
jgi:hypothetical protein